MVPEDRPEIPEPNGEKIEPHRIIPIYEANAFSEFRAPEDILILISDIEKRPNQFTPEKIKRLRDRIEGEKTFREAWLKLRERADRLLKEKLVSKELLRQQHDQ